MPTALQVALFMACAAIVLFVSLMIPLSILLYRCVRDVARQMNEVEANLKELIQDSRTLIQNINQLAARANKQLDELDKVVQVVRGWSERVDQVFEEVGSAVAVPALRIAHTIKVLRNTWRLILDAIFGDSQQRDHKDTEGS